MAVSLIPSGVPVSRVVARRFVLGRQGLWPGRRWVGIDGLRRALRTVECVQMDPLNVVGRNHDLALRSRVDEYRPTDLNRLLYEDRQFFDYGANLRVYAMSELPFWRVTMRRKAGERRWADYADQNGAVLDEVRAELGARGPLANRDFTGRSRVTSYRGGKDSAVALYYLWLSGEVMVHHRIGFERVYDFAERVAPPALDHAATVDNAERFFARKAIAVQGWCTPRSWARSMAFFTARKIDLAEAHRWLDDLQASGDVARVAIEGERDPCYVPSRYAEQFDTVAAGRVPHEWRPLAATTSDEAVFLAPLDTVVARGRARALFDFDYLWEVYKPAVKRRWGYYTLPVLYGDLLVARLDPGFEHASKTLVVNGLWIDDPALERDADFAEALARGLSRLAEFVGAVRVDASAVKPMRLRQHLDVRLKALAIHARPASGQAR